VTAPWPFHTYQIDGISAENLFLSTYLPCPGAFESIVHHLPLDIAESALHKNQLLQLKTTQASDLQDHEGQYLGRGNNPS
jgi:hypothetical protein